MGRQVKILGQMISGTLIPKPLFDPDTKYMRKLKSGYGLQMGMFK
jgi:hypothetical protein